MIRGIYICGGKNDVSDKSLNEYLIIKSIELTCIMDDLAQSDEYISFIVPQSELNGLITDIGSCDYQVPNSSILINISDATMNTIMEKYVGKFNLPDDAYKLVVTRMHSSIPAMINEQQGANVITATSILSANKAFQQHKDFSDTTYVILIYDKYSSITVYSSSVEGITLANTTFIFFTDDMKKAVAEKTAVNYIFENFNISGVKIEYIDGNKIAEYK